jgi:cyclic pyranopterin phosphate synthase
VLHSRFICSFDARRTKVIMTSYQPIPLQSLHDNHGRRFTYLRLSITDVCNFRCHYCLPNGYQGDGEPQPLSLPEIQQTVAAFAALGTRKVRVTGGEPVLRRDLTDILRAISSTPGIEQLAITTNGYKLPQHIDSWAAAGLSQLNVSIDSLDARVFKAITGHDRLREILSGIERALELELPVKVNAVLLRDQQDQLPQFLAWLRHTPVTLRFIELMQTGSQPDYFKRHHISGDVIRQQLLQQGWQALPRSPHAGPAQEYQHPEYAGRIGLIMPYSPNFCSSCNRLRISAAGKLHLCLFGEHGYDLRPLLQPQHQAELRQQLQELLQLKAAGHDLHQGNSGAIQHFAMIGG